MIFYVLLFLVLIPIGLIINYPIITFFAVFGAAFAFFVFQYTKQHQLKYQNYVKEHDVPKQTASEQTDKQKQLEENTPHTNDQTSEEIRRRLGHAVSTQVQVGPWNASSVQSKYIAFDVETTGLNRALDRIIELGAVLFVDGKPEKTFSSLVNPHVSIPASVTAINHITDNMIASAPPEEKVYPEFLDFLGGAVNGEIVMCAHNASFDFDFLCNTLSRLGYDANFRYVDTLGLSRKYIKGLRDYKQSTLEDYFFLHNAGAHRAASDAENCGKILYQVLTKASSTPVPIPTKTKTETVYDNFSRGSEYWKQGEEARKNGEIEKALQLFDKARDIGFRHLAIYESYAKAYRKLTDYESEILILDEAIKSSYSRPYVNSRIVDEFKIRKDRAQKLLLARQKKEEELREKELKRTERAEKKAREAEMSKPRKPRSQPRPVIQCTDDGTVIKKYESIASAAEATCISTKCISDAARGKQKHAGGFCWKYVDFSTDSTEGDCNHES